MAVVEAPAPWLRTFRSVAVPRLRLVCFPHGGGAASAFSSWPAMLPAGVELVAVQYPAREDRVGESMPGRLVDAAGEVAAGLVPLLTVPYALFGHSMGATLAYEVAQRLRAIGSPAPRHLVVSGREAPYDEQGGDVHRRDDDGVVAELLRLGATDREILADPGLRAMIVRYVREDYRLIETYVPAEQPPLDCPITIFLGVDDPDLGPALARRWHRVTGRRTELRIFPGGHFYLVPHRDEVIAALLAAATG